MLGRLQFEPTAFWSYPIQLANRAALIFQGIDLQITPLKESFKLCLYQHNGSFEILVLIKLAEVGLQTDGLIAQSNNFARTSNRCARRSPDCVL